MLQQLSRFLVLLLVTLGSGACATMSDVVASKHEGTVATYDVGTDDAWSIAMTVFRWEGADAIEEHREQNYMLTSSGGNLVSWGSVMGAWVEPAGEGRSKVTVVTKRRVSTNIATTLTESTFHARFAQAVDILKSGGSLPIEPPPAPE